MCVWDDKMYMLIHTYCKNSKYLIRELYTQRNILYLVLWAEGLGVLWWYFGGLMTNSIQSFVHDPHLLLLAKRKLCLQHVLVILKHSLQNHLNMFPLYYMDSDMFSMFKSLATHSCVIRLERND